MKKIKKIVSRGVDIFQLRDKNLCDKELLAAAKEIVSFCKKRKALFIINDRVDVALAAGADGVHLGQGDLPIKEARKILPRNFLIGVSTHSLKQALKAQEEGADYIGFGPLFATKTKPRLSPIGVGEIEKLNEKIKIPYFAIGNINLKNLKLLRKKNVKRIAVHSAIYNLKEPKEKILAFKKELFGKEI